MKKSIKETVREAIEPTVTELGYRIWDVTYSKIGADYHLEITIDNDEGIGISDCEKVHRAIDPILDECDPIEGFYYLEVSSPGAERDIRTDEHIEACKGEKIEAKRSRLYKNNSRAIVSVMYIRSFLKLESVRRTYKRVLVGLAHLVPEWKGFFK